MFAVSECGSTHCFLAYRLLPRAMSSGESLGINRHLSYHLIGLPLLFNSELLFFSYIDLSSLVNINDNDRYYFPFLGVLEYVSAGFVLRMMALDQENFLTCSGQGGIPPLLGC